MPEHETAATRRQLLSRIGAVAGAGALYQAMTSLGHAAASDFVNPPKLSGARPGTSVLILGSGLAGMVAAYELQKAGYKVQILEYQNRAGGRNFSLRGGDTFEELGGAVQHVGFAQGNYFNPGPWRIPYHHQAVLHYCRTLGVALEPFVQVNHNAYVHSSSAFNGAPQRYRVVDADYSGYVSELLAKSLNQHALDNEISADEREHILQSLKSCGMLDASYAYKKSDLTSMRRGYEKPPGGGLDGPSIASTPLSRGDIFSSGLWQTISVNSLLNHQTSMFQPVGGMDQIGKAFQKQLQNVINLRCKVTAIHQDDSGVSVTYTDDAHGSVTRIAKADYCICTIPLSILSQLDIQVSGSMRAAIAAVPYAPAIKVGLEFNRRFWEEDEQIYGGISFTDLPITQISYPSTKYFSNGKAVLLGAYLWEDVQAFRFAGMTPAERIEASIASGEKIHKQYRKEYSSGVAVAWSRVPWAMGCSSIWSEQRRKDHYKNLCTMDNRIVLAGEHASYIGGWQEGSMLSSINAIEQLHKRASGVG